MAEQRKPYGHLDPLPPIDYHANQTESLEDYTLKVKYNTLKDSREHSVVDIPLTPPDQRSLKQEFVLKMWLKCEIPFFQDFSPQTCENLSRCLHQHSYNKSDVIYQKNDMAECAYIVV